MKNDVISLVGMIAWMVAYFISQATLEDQRAINKELLDKITSPRQFELESKIYRCYHFPEIKDKK